MDPIDRATFLKLSAFGVAGYLESLVRADESRLLPHLQRRLRRVAASYSHSKSAHYLSHDLLSRHDSLRGMDGEVCSTHFGSIRGEGVHVYLTGLTPFRHVVNLR